MRSLWSELKKEKSRKALERNISTDVLIIGGGMAGLLCAKKLTEAGVDCVLTESTEICGGVTKNTTAKITVQHGLIYDRLIRTIGEAGAKLYLEVQKAALSEYLRYGRDIDCDLEKKESFVYSLTDTQRLEKEFFALRRLGEAVRFADGTDFPFETAGAVCVQGQAQFHPLKFAYELEKDLTIYENTKVREIMPGKALTAGGEIRCKKMIVTTHFPVLNKHGAYFLKMYQDRSYVIALEGAQKLSGMYVDENEKGLSFRTYGDLLLLGGGSHRTGKGGGGYACLEEYAKKYYPKAKIVKRWATQDCMTLDGVPYIGNYSASTPDLYVATGFNKWGMTSSMAAAMILSDLVQGKENKYASVFSPSRNMCTSQLVVNAFESFVGLVTPTAPRCPHLGCALKYNPEEHSWDCPCHGSRFTKGGEVIDNPATDDMKMK